MDTIEISLKINNQLGIDLVQSFIHEISSLKSPYGYTFCDVIEVSRRGNAIIKISYPRYFYGNNAYLITKRSECFEVQKYFADNIMEHEFWKENIGELCLLRVDIPFTYYMSDKESFTGYENIYRICAVVYNKLKKNARPKAFMDIISKSFETVTYSDNGRSDKSANNKLMIYDQYKNLNKKLEKEVFEETILENDDLPNRIRMEVSKRIKLRRNFDSKGFSEFDILGSYFQSYKEYILRYALNMNKIDELYDIWAEDLAKILIEKRMSVNFNYEIFILENLLDLHDKGYIYDYEILRRAIKIVIKNENTRENAITRVRKILTEIEEEKELIIMNTYAILLKMARTIHNYKLMD